jgi:hypothetical protein
MASEAGGLCENPSPFSSSHYSIWRVKAASLKKPPRAGGGGTKPPQAAVQKPTTNAFLTMVRHPRSPPFLTRVALLLDASGLHCQSNKCPHHRPHSPRRRPCQVKVSKSASTSSLVTIHVVGCQVVSRGKDGVTNHLGRKEQLIRQALIAKCLIYLIDFIIHSADQ